jgi:hypothetical protein
MVFSVRSAAPPDQSTRTRTCGVKDIPRISVVSTMTTSVPGAMTPHPNCRKIGTVRVAPAGICTPSTGIGEDDGIVTGDEPGIGIDDCVGIGIGVRVELEVDSDGAVAVAIASGIVRWPARSVNSNRSPLAMMSEPAPIVMMIRTPKVEPPGHKRFGTSSAVAVAGSAATEADVSTVGALGLAWSPSLQPADKPNAGKRRSGTYFEKPACM